MKILSISTHDINGGAAVAATRLHLALREAEVDSTMLVAEKIGADPHTRALHNNFTYSLRRNLERLPLKLERTPESIAWRSLAWLPNRKLARAIEAHQPDLIHLHWAQNGFFPLRLLGKLRQPLVWTFHDLWPVCGSFHHEYENDHRNPAPSTRANRPAGRRGPDLDRRVWNTKHKLYKRVPIQAIVPSRWMAEQVSASALWRDRELHVIPNGLDPRIFKPLDRKAARDLLNLPQNKTIILFGAMYAGSDRNKGYSQLSAALRHLTLSQERTELAVFGMAGPVPGDDPLPYPTRWLGVLRDPFTLAALYSAADLMVVPSLQESFGQTASEPMACGTPVAAFDTSGLRDIIDHKTNGYLAQPFEPEDLAAGIEWILADPGRLTRLQTAAREKVTSTFDSALVARRHLELYRDVLEAKPS
jgi:glycosyltransferase involved in cell wall biosynthesis